MSGARTYILLWSICLLFAARPCLASPPGDKGFVVVIDAGHGGHDPGALGRKAKEKNINLNVALKLGKLIEQNCKDVAVVYTRKKDVFVALDKRADIANKAKADLFISIHTNALAKNKTMKGASTWTLGLAKSDDNLAVAKRENNVILLENDYQTRYEGFDPGSAESYIMFEYYQSRYMEQSVQLAKLIQKQFKTESKRRDQSVHQAGFLVLKACAMPSVLVELGFISTPEEENYLSTEAGSSSMAKSIYKAFVQYRQGTTSQLEERGSPAGKKSEAGTPTPAAAPQPESRVAATAAAPSKTPTTTPQKQAAEQDKPVFMIQFLTSNVKLSANDKRLKGLKPVEHYREGNLYKYTYAASTDYNEVSRKLQTVRASFKDAFIIAFKRGEKMNANKAINEFKQQTSNKK